MSDHDDSTPDNPSPFSPVVRTEEYFMEMELIGELKKFFAALPRHVLNNHTRIALKMIEEGKPLSVIRIDYSAPMDRQIADLAESMGVTEEELTRETDPGSPDWVIK